MQFKHNLLNICFYLAKKTEIKITAVDELEETFSQLWLNKESLDSIIKNNQDEFLKRIPIKINELNPLYSKMVESTLQKQNVLVRKK